MQSIRNVLPNENLLYVADSASAPYGDKSESFIQNRSMVIADFLITRGAKLLVVACNTATVTSVQILREKYDVPIVAVEPGVKPAVLSSKSKKVGILATEQTVSSASFNRLLARFSKDALVIPQGCPGLVELIEQSKLDSSVTVSLLRKFVDPLLNQGVDTLVMGCTHYAFIVPTLQRLVGEDINIITTHEAVAAQVRLCLELEGLLSSASVIGSVSFCSSSSDKTIAKTITKLLGVRVYVNHIR